jgi:PIN domain
MPPFDEQAVKTAIATDAIGAISVDTSVFDRRRCNLDAQVLQSLGQFRGTRTRVLLSEIVVGEVSGHIERNAEQARAGLKAALGVLRKSWRRPVDNAAVDELLGIRQTSAEFARNSVAQFVSALGIEIVQADGLVGHSEVLRRYFAVEPPFSRGELKKNEFPDALALLSLEGWAARNRTTVLVISGDKDWQAFAEHSDRLIAVPDLTVALDYFNSAAAFAVARCMALLARDSSRNSRPTLNSH